MTMEQYSRKATRRLLGGIAVVVVVPDSVGDVAADDEDEGADDESWT